MIIMNLRGGLGNQLFQYSLGRHLSIINKTQFKVNISGYTEHVYREYSLSPFNICSTVATEREVYDTQYSISARLFNLFKPYYKKTFVNERRYSFDPDILKIGSYAYLNGFWQSEKYFCKIADIIRKELTLKKEPVGKNKLLLREITATEAVCLHIRRGDYISSAATNAFQGVCSPRYYTEAVSFIARKASKIHFYIFSDDIPWVRKNLLLKYPMTFVEHNNKVAHEDLRLMSNCKHFIIANSTFSWWGAWLSSYKDKIVISPKRWFNDKTIDDKDLIPERWIRL